MSYATIGINTNATETNGEYKFVLHSKRTIDACSLINNVLPLVLLQMLKDSFSDYEDLNVLTPVRFQGLKVIQMLCKYATHNPVHATPLTESIQMLIQNMPQLIFACENEWQAKLSFFMIFKAMITYE